MFGDADKPPTAYFRQSSGQWQVKSALPLRRHAFAASREVNGGLGARSAKQKGRSETLALWSVGAANSKYLRQNRASGTVEKFDADRPRLRDTGAETPAG